MTRSWTYLEFDETAARIRGAAGGAQMPQGVVLAAVLVVLKETLDELDDPDLPLPLEFVALRALAEDVAVRILGEVFDRRLPQDLNTIPE
jgi:hypothetical protein